MMKYMGTSISSRNTQKANMSTATKAPTMPDSRINMAATKPRLRSRTKPMAWGESGVTSIISVVSNTSQREMPSTPRRAPRRR